MSDTKPIYFGPGLESGADVIAGASPIATNVVIDGRGVVRRRPGLSAAVYDTFDGPVRALHETEAGHLYAISGGYAYKVAGGSAVRMAGGPIQGASRPTVAETEMLLAIAAGAAPHKVVLADGTQDLLGGSPPHATHIIAHRLRLLGNDAVTDRTKVRYSDVSQGTLDYSGHETWTFGGIGLSGFFTAEARPDPVVAIGEDTNEVYVWGSSNLQVFAPDGQSVYAPVATKEYGCSAPYSIIRTDDGFAWLDHRRRFILSDGRSYKDLGADIQSTLDGVSEWNDCYGFRVKLGPVDAMAWRFPTDGRTFVLQSGGGWAQWTGYGSSGPVAFPISSHAHSRVSNTNYVGTDGGVVAELGLGVATDLGDPIVAHVETGFIDRGTSLRKKCVAVRVTLRRGESSTDSVPVAHLSYADQPGHWSAPIPLSFGTSGDTESTLVLRSLGVYRRRAWRFQFSGEVDLALVRVDEEFETLSQ